MTELERKRAVETGMIYPEPEEEVPTVPKHWAEMMMMHMSRAIRNMTIGFVAGFIAMVIMALIFVNGYTSRTKDWLNTLAGLQGGNPAATEVQNGIQQQPDP